MFVDYGNSDNVETKHVVWSREEIPDTDDVDECVQDLVLPSDTSSPIVNGKVKDDVKDQFEDMVYKVGEKVLAKWSDDDVWYNATVLRVTGSEAQVRFDDYGNEATEDLYRIVRDSSDIPASDADNIDECVVISATSVTSNVDDVKNNEKNEPNSSASLHQVSVLQLQVGELVFAKWDEDKTWYNAKIIKINEENADVEFVDYGNEDKVQKSHIVKLSTEIPSSDDYDENISLSSNSDPTTNNNNESIAVDTLCIAKWDEDNVWYRAKVLQFKTSSRTYEVEFIDYGNKAFVPEHELVLSAQLIPKDQKDQIDENVLSTISESTSKPVIVSKDTKENANLDVLEKVESKTDLLPLFAVASQCIAKWDEDGVWYRAKVVGQDHSSKMYEVEFIDYGNTAQVDKQYMVMEAKEIPADERQMIDENVSTSFLTNPISKPRIQNANNFEDVDANIPVQEKLISDPEENPNVLAKNIECIAKWDEDNVWYRAKVLSKDKSSNKYEVEFIDYGNTEHVQECDIVMEAKDIPPDQLDLIDENVVTSSTDLTSQSLIHKSEESKSDPKENQANFANGTKCIAKWDEDNVWYRAKILSKDKSSFKYEVEFIDYGNTAVVPEGDIVLKAEEIPDDQQEMIDENVTLTNNAIADSAEVILPPSSGENTSKDNVEKKTHEDTNLDTGTICIAKWDEDKVWYRSKIISQVKSPKTFEVEFLEYGNTAQVSREHIVLAKSQIPSHELDMVDINVVDGGNIECNTSQTNKSSHNESLDVAKDVPTETFDQKRVSEIKDVTESFKVGDKVIAKWLEDGIWYNAEIMSKSDDGFQVLFCDYGNEEIVKDIVKTVSGIPSSETIDECVDISIAMESKSKEIVDTKKLEYSESPIILSNFQVGDICIAKWEDDQTWYNAKILDIGGHSVNVCFVDYGNEDSVTSIVRSVSELPNNCDVDVNIGNDQKTVDETASLENSRASSGVGDSILSVQTNFLAFLETEKDGSLTLAARKKIVIKDLNGPVGVSLLNDNSIGIVSRNDQVVFKYSKTGNPLGKLELPNRKKFIRPTDIYVLKCGETLIRDGMGIHRFSPSDKYLDKIGEACVNKYFGITEDKEGNVITINCNVGDDVGPGNLTKKNHTDLFFFNMAEGGKLCYRVELEDVIPDSTRATSLCRHLGYDEVHDKLYVADLGRNIIYSFYPGEESNERFDAAGVFGDPGDKLGQFNKPAGFVMDDLGSMIVVDSSNNRLQIVNRDWNSVGTVKVKYFMKCILLWPKILQFQSLVNNRPPPWQKFSSLVENGWKILNIGHFKQNFKLFLKF